MTDEEKLHAEQRNSMHAERSLADDGGSGLTISCCSFCSSAISSPPFR